MHVPTSLQQWGNLLGMNMRAMCRSLLAFVRRSNQQLQLTWHWPCADGVWASFFAFFYRKFLWDFVGGILRNPGGLQWARRPTRVLFVNPISRPAPGSATFVALIIQYPVIQSVALVWGLLIIASEYPIPQLKLWVIYRTLVARIVLLLFQFLLGSLYYQVCKHGYTLIILSV